MGRWFWLGLLALWLWWGPLAPAWATAVTDLPPSPPATPVLDEADVFSPSTLKQVNRTLTQLAKDTGFQVHVVSLRRLDYGETASSFGEKLFQRWFPDGGARQVLLTVVARTATGDLQAGSEAAARLSPATAVSIVQDTLLKPVRNNVYNQALLDTVARLQAVLSGQPDPGPPPEEVERVEGTFATAAETRRMKDLWTGVVLVLLILATVIPMVTYYWYVLR